MLPSQATIWLDLHYNAESLQDDPEFVQEMTAALTGPRPPNWVKVAEHEVQTFDRLCAAFRKNGAVRTFLRSPSRSRTAEELATIAIDSLDDQLFFLSVDDIRSLLYFARDCETHDQACDLRKIHFPTGLPTPPTR